jgi:hypothetical protein
MIRSMLCVGALASAVFVSTVPAAHAATVAPEKWAPKVCSALSGYLDTIDTGSEALNEATDGATNLKQARAELVKYYGKLEAAAKKAQKSLESAGAPSSKNGEKVATMFVSALDTSAGIFGKAKTDAAKISTSSPGAYAKQGAAVNKSVEKAGNKLGDSLDKVRTLDADGELLAAVQSEPACAALSS